MSDFRDDFDMHPDYRARYDHDRAGFIGPLVALGVLIVMITGFILLAGGTGDVNAINGGATPPAASSQPSPGSGLILQ